MSPDRTSPRKPVVFLTGASRGLGLAMATILLKELNSIVVAVSRTRTAALVKLTEEHPKDLLTIEADISNELSVRKAVRTAIKAYNHLDALILNAGTYELGRVRSPETTAESWRTDFEINFFSLLYTVQEALPSLLKSELGGRIICVSSGCAIISVPSLGAYSASKAAMNSFCRTLGVEEPGVVTIAFRPHLVDTNMTDTLMGPENANKVDPAFLHVLQERVKTGQVHKAEDVGYCIASLALKAPKAMSGQFLDWASEDCQAFKRT